MDLLRRSRYLATLSVGLGWLALTTCRGDEARPEPEIQALAAALGERRPVEPRLTGGFAYAPCKIIDEPGRLLPRVACSEPPAPGSRASKAVTEIIGRLGDDSSRKEGGHAQGVARLVWGANRSAATNAVAALEQAATQAPRDARILSDLAAAYLVRAHQEDDPRDVVRALDASARAHRADSSLPEALFNLSLALERLHLGRSAVEAWKDYLALDVGSPWSEEARRHLQRYRQPDAAQEWAAIVPKLEAAALRNQTDLVLRFVQKFPQPAREHALEKSLGGWGEALEYNNPQGAALQLQIASQIGEALKSLHGDLSVVKAVAAIERARVDSAQLRQLASGHREFRDGMRAYRSLRTDGASVHFAAAQALLNSGESPVKLWAQCGLARCLGYEGRYDEAISSYKTILREAEPQGLSSLTGWTQWGLSWIAARQGLPAEALSRARAMEEAYQKINEAENLGAARYLIGQLLFLVGQRESGWRYDYLALKALATLPAVFRRHVVLTDAATDAFEEGLPEASLLLQTEALRAAQEAQDPLRLAEIHKARAKVLGSIGRIDEALADLNIAQHEARQVPQDSTGKKLRADLLWNEGEVWLHQDPRRASEALTRAISEYEGLNATVSIAYASLTRAKALLALGFDGPAETDLQRALRILEDPATNIAEEDLRLSYYDSIQEAYDAMILFQWERNRNAKGSLQELEKARNLFAVSSKGGLPYQRLPGNGVVVEYALLQDRLLIWVLDRNGCRTFEGKVNAWSLNAKVNRFLKAIEAAKDRDSLVSLAAELYTLLIPKPVADLPQGKIVYFIPDKILNRVPFAALRNPESSRYFVQDHPLAISPSLEQLLATAHAERREAKGGIESVLLAGNPAFDRTLFPALGNLSHAEAEILAARDSFKISEVLVATQVTKPDVLARLDQFDAFVFAGHAVTNLSFPSQSYLLLAPSREPPDPGLLLGKEIQARKLHRLRLVVLSACSSIGPRVTRTSGLAGMARPFLRAGVPNVVGTLWDVRDRESAALLPIFYRALAAGKSEIHALQEMQVVSIQRGASSGMLPTWSAFELVAGQLERRGNV